MPGRATLAYGNEILDTLLLLNNVTYPTLAAGASASTTVTVNGIQPLDLLSWNLQTPTAHLQIDNMIAGLNQITILWGTDATGITGAATGQVLVEVVRLDGANLGASVYPSQIAF